MIIEIENLKKSYKDVKAVDDISFSVNEGELFSFLGMNGAGKSTTINIMSGVLKKDDGRVCICGYDIDLHENDVKSKLGIVFQNSVLDKKLNVYENLKYRANLYGIFGKEFNDRLDEMTKLLDLKDILKRPLGKLSGGQKRRIDIARALIHRPKLLILDEPTTGLDPSTRINIWNVVEKLRRDDGLTVFLTTHYMEEAADSDHVVIIDSGKIAAEGTPHELKNQYASDFIKLYNHKDEAEKYFSELGYAVKNERDFIEVELKSTAETTKFFKERPQFFDDFEVLKGNMDNVFLKVTGKNLQGD
ncbi:MAG: ABC transporter ATP-binding protein [Clostridia bacterium]|nr:ABC transporter ATP-binding protein [Clostridia bacterium]MDE7328830.1 ABC transporter ATP-binding protein [Clostridia bacterium]